MSEQLEIVAGLAQRYLSEKPTFVLGSGASIALGLPGMEELGDTLLSEVCPENADEASQWGSFEESFSASKDLEGALNEVHLAPRLLDEVVLKTWSLISMRDLIAYREIVASASFHPLSDAFRHFLRVADPKLDVVTTNYDRLAEYAANAAGAQAYTGLTHGWLQQLTTANPAPSRRQINVWKVHGSLDWFVAEDRQIHGLPMMQEIFPSLKPVIVTPGVTKYLQAHLEPFRTVMAQADSCLASSRVLLCIGYGFNDEHVQPKLVNRIRQDGIPLVVLTHTLTDAARRMLFDDPPRKFLAIEKKGDGSIAYYPENIAGEEFFGINIWELGNFMRVLLEP
ncbi:SIR2 family protein [Halomonas sp. H10-9-1]|uniref:SIR2 family protein n=1 Tax=Halomonas sp. H10-9-1 TaxID=2950871 RepID=UPI0032DF95B4